MTEFCSSSKQPRIFFTFCCVFFLIIVIVSILFLYYPDGIGLSNEEYDFDKTIHSSSVRDSRGKMSQVKEDYDMDVDNDGDVFMLEYEDNVYNIKPGESSTTLTVPDNLSPDQESIASGGGSGIKRYLNNDEGKIRHHHLKHQVLSLDQVEEKPFMSNVIETRLMHLDLKGAPPKVSYLKEVMKLAKHAGINGLLIEWEDTFPWKGVLGNLSLTEGAYSFEEVEDIINFAEKSMGFEVIPLIQAFGHVEFILKGPDFKHLREVDNDPQSYCPSKAETMDVIDVMIDQIIEFHKNSRFIHIGCDEVSNLRVCPICISSSEYKDALFLKHVIKVAKNVKSKGRIPIIWDDMLRTVSLRNLNESGIGSLVEPMVWVYAEDVDRFVGWDTWEKYATIFPTIWGAGAFKGAFGETLSIPPLSRHADNVLRWVEVISRESPKWNKGSGGIVLTGWMRYDHFSVLAELLPASIPSLIYTSLIASIPASSASSIKNRIFVPKTQHIQTTTPTTPYSSSTSEVPSTSTNETNTETEHVIAKRSPPNVKRKILHPPRILMAKDKLSQFSSIGTGQRTAEVYDKGDILSKKFAEILHCPNYHTRLDALVKGSDGELSFASRCNFVGVGFYRSVFRLRQTLQEIWETVEKIQRKRGWVTPYNIRHNYSLPSRVNEVVFTSVPRLRRQLEVIIKSVELSLQPIFRQEVILEWIEQNIWEAWKALDKLEKDGEILRNTNIWTKRPLRSPWEMVQKLRLSRLSRPDDDEL